MKRVNYTIKYRRRRQFKTDYIRRRKLLSSGRLRLVIRTTLNNIYAQIVRYNPKGDEVLVSAKTKDLEKLGWSFGKSNTPAAYLLGVMIAKKSLKQKINDVIVDTGRVSPIKGSKIYGCIKGAIDGGLKISCPPEKMPSEERISGKHASSKMPELFSQVKSKIMGM